MLRKENRKRLIKIQCNVIINFEPDNYPMTFTELVGQGYQQYSVET